MPIKLNELESQRFGVTVVHLTDDSAPLAEVTQAARAAGADVVFTRTDTGDLPRAHALEADGYRLMDTLVYYDHSLQSLPERRPAAGRVIRRATAADLAAVAGIALVGFRNYLGHYHADPRLSDEAADAAYVEWAETCARRATEAAPVFLAEVDGTPIGFLALRRNTPQEVEIVLNAVLPAARGRGVYGALVTEALYFAQADGAERVIVSTQVNNTTPQRAWARLGLAACRSLYTFHKWIPDTGAQVAR